MVEQIEKLILLLVIAVPVSIIDIREMRIPDRLVFSGVLSLAIMNFLNPPLDIFRMFLTGVTGFLPFFLIRMITRGKIGLGDAKFSIFLILLLGIEGWLLMIFIASLTALIIAILLLIIFKTDKSTKIPFGPFLGFGALVSQIHIMAGLL